MPAPFAVFALQLNSRQHQQLLRHSHYCHTMLISYSHHASDETSCNACLRMLEWGLEEEKTFGVHCSWAILKLVQLQLNGFEFDSVSGHAYGCSQGRASGVRSAVVLTSSSANAIQRPPHANGTEHGARGN